MTLDEVDRTPVQALLVGVAVALALSLTWYPAIACDGEGLSCLGDVVVTILATPVVAFLVALVVGALVRLRRPWLLALLGPLAAYGLIRTAFFVLGPGWVALGVSAALIAVAYPAIGLLLRPGTSAVSRLAAAVVVAVLVLGPGLLES